MNTVGKRIKERRKQLCLSVDDVADILDKNRATVYRYESDEIENLPINILEPLAKVLHTTPAYLMGWEEEAKEESPVMPVHPLVAKYNTLDERGKHTVDTVLEMEYNRCDKSHLWARAAHNDNKDPEQVELMRRDLEEL